MRRVWVLWMAGLTTGGWLAVAAALARHGTRLPPAGGRHDAIIVAGARLDERDELSPAFRRRVYLGVALWRQGAAPILVTTGGPTGSGPAGATVAARAAVDLGVPADSVIPEDRSRSTWENALFAARIVQGSGGADVVVVTDTYHAFRCERVFRRHFGKAVVSTTRPAIRVLVRQSLRESLAVGWYALCGRL